ncbi:MAG: ParB/RepB/Spo0J family partition protein [Gammaproteobacteria bacterium]|nr:ParB/RepB/Spo0J family partition protein [Gammaproteobacteria bacterium]
MKKRGLGRGLDALLGSAGIPEQTPATKDLAGLRELPVDLIERSRYQPRADFNEEALQELADSIRAQGVIQPIVVRPLAGHPNRYELIAGERRWRAAQLAGLHEVPAVVREVDDQAAMAMALIENIQRQALNPIEEAVALNRLIGEFGLTHEQTAEAVGRSRAAVSNMLRLLNLEADVKTMVEQRQLEMGHARALLALRGAAQIRAARHVVDKGLSVRETERLVKKQGEPKPQAESAARTLDPDTQRLQDELSERLGAKVHFQAAKGGKGKLIIQYNSLDELDGILSHIK